MTTQLLAALAVVLVVAVCLVVALLSRRLRQAAQAGGHKPQTVRELVQLRTAPADDVSGTALFTPEAPRAPAPAAPAPPPVGEVPRPAHRDPAARTVEMGVPPTPAPPVALPPDGVEVGDAPWRRAARMMGSEPGAGWETAPVAATPPGGSTRGPQAPRPTVRDDATRTGLVAIPPSTGAAAVGAAAIGAAAVGAAVLGAVAAHRATMSPAAVSDGDAADAPPTGEPADADPAPAGRTPTPAVDEDAVVTIPRSAGFTPAGPRSDAAGAGPAAGAVAAAAADPAPAGRAPTPPVGPDAGVTIPRSAGLTLLGGASGASAAGATRPASAEPAPAAPAPSEGPAPGKSAPGKTVAAGTAPEPSAAGEPAAPAGRAAPSAVPSPGPDAPSRPLSDPDLTPLMGFPVVRAPADDPAPPVPPRSPAPKPPAARPAPPKPPAAANPAAKPAAANPTPPKPAAVKPAPAKPAPVRPAATGREPTPPPTEPVSPVRRRLATADDETIVLLPATVARPAPPALPAVAGSPQPVWFRVVRRDGEPVGGVVVALLDDRGHEVDVTKTATDGGGELHAPRAGRFLMIASADGFQPRAVTLAVDDQPVEVALLLPRSASVGGAVREYGAPAAGVRVVAHQEGEVVDEIVTDREGGYRLDDLAEGVYVLSASGGPARGAAVSRVRLSEGSDVHLDLDLAPAKDAR